MQGEKWLELSQDFLDKGLSVIPVIGKAPPLTNWQRWCVELPDKPLVWSAQTGIGLCLGPASDLVCVDIDTDDKEILDLVPPSPVRRRGKKGEVRFFKYSRDIESKTFHAHRIEILSIGRQVVLPPSIHPETKEPYQWLGPSLLEFDLDHLPTLDLSFVSKLKNVAVNPMATVGGRNNTLKNIVCAVLTRSESVEFAAKEVYEYDREHHNPRLFTDPKENWGAKDEGAAQLAAMTFASQIHLSLLRSKVVQPVLNFEAFTGSEPSSSKAFALKSYPEPRGVLKDLVLLINECSYTHVPNMALGSAIAIFATMMGNKFSFEEVKANSFCLLLAESGTGKKFGINAARQLLGEHRLVGSADYLSSSAISSSLSDYCVRLDVSDEFSKTLKIAKDGGHWQASMFQDFCKLWSSSTDGFDLPVTKKKEDEKEAPTRFVSTYVSILSATTLSEFKDSISKTAFTSGLIPRFLLFMDEPSDFVKTRLNYEAVKARKEICQRFVLSFLELQNKNPMTGHVEPVEMTLSEEANVFFEHQMNLYHQESKNEQNDLIKPILNRSREHLKKLSMIHSVSRLDGKNEINLEDLKWAAEVIAVSQHNSSIFMGEASAENKTHAVKERVFGIISKHGKLTRKQLTDKTRFLDDNTRQGVLKDLVIEGRIGYADGKCDKNGKEVKTYFAI